MDQVHTGGPIWTGSVSWSRIDRVHGLQGGPWTGSTGQDGPWTWVHVLYTSETANRKQTAVKTNHKCKCHIPALIAPADLI